MGLWARMKGAELKDRGLHGRVLPTSAERWLNHPFDLIPSCSRRKQGKH